MPADAPPDNEEVSLLPQGLPLPLAAEDPAALSGDTEALDLCKEEPRNTATSTPQAVDAAHLEAGSPLEEGELAETETAGAPALVVAAAPTRRFVVRTCTWTWTWTWTCPAVLCRGLHVNFVPLDATSAEVCAFFEHFGPVERAALPEPKKPAAFGPAWRFASVLMERQEDAQAALRQRCGPLRPGGRMLKVLPSRGVLRPVEGEMSKAGKARGRRGEGKAGYAREAQAAELSRVREPSPPRADCTLEWLPPPGARISGGRRRSASPARRSGEKEQPRRRSRSRSRSPQRGGSSVQERDRERERVREREPPRRVRSRTRTPPPHPLRPLRFAAAVAPPLAAPPALKVQYKSTLSVPSIQGAFALPLLVLGDSLAGDPALPQPLVLSDCVPMTVVETLAAMVPLERRALVSLSGQHDEAHAQLVHLAKQLSGGGEQLAAKALAPDGGCHFLCPPSEAARRLLQCVLGPTAFPPYNCAALAVLLLLTDEAAAIAAAVRQSMESQIAAAQAQGQRE